MNRAGSVLLDTSVIVDYIRGDQRFRPLFAAAVTMYVPLVVLGELHFGAQLAPRRNDAITQVREFVRIATVLLPDENTAEQYGQIKPNSQPLEDRSRKTMFGSPPWRGSMICR